MSGSGSWPRFTCPTCGRSIASVYRDPLHVSLPDDSGRRHEYAYLRRHKGPDGQPCPTDTAHVATIIPRAR